ncbi:MAG: MAPEG family protein [Parvibaculaceae bacterium]
MMIDNPVQMVGLYIALNLLLNLVLAYRVSAGRVRTNLMTGTGEDDPLYNASRAHVVNVEYTPIGLIGLLGLFILSASVWVIHVVGVALTLGRLLHAIGLSRSSESTPPRLWGTLITWFGQLIAGLGCLYYALA